jgi:hypothetical protein
MTSETDSFEASVESSDQTTQDDSEVSTDQPGLESTPPPATRIKVKVDGQELELSQEELVRDYQMRQASEKRFQEASKLRQEAQAQIDALQYAKENPIEFFKQTGVNAKAFAEQVLLQELEESMLSPQERELRDLRNYKLGLEEQQKKKAHEELVKERSQLEDQYANEIQDEILEVLSANKMKPSPRNIAKVAEFLSASLDDNGNRMHAKDALERVKQNQREDVLLHIAELSPEEIESQFPEFYKSLLNHSAKRANVVLPNASRQSVAAHKPIESKQQSYSSFWNAVKQGK